MVSSKRCFKCNELKLLNEFYVHPQMADGHLGKCKLCTKKDVRERRELVPEMLRAYEKKRSQIPVRRAAQKARNKSDKRRQWALQYRRTSKHRAWKVEYTRKRRLFVEPEKYKARMMAGNAIRDGRLIRKPCRACGSTVRVHAHHHDYSKPLDVDWLCAPCHRHEHQGHGADHPPF